MTAAERLVEWAWSLSLDQVPREARHAACRHLLDGLGTALAAARLDAAPFALSVASGLGGPAEATVLGDGRRLSAPAAALANGVLLHALDYDDTHADALVHPTATAITPARFPWFDAGGYTFSLGLRHGRSAYLSGHSSSEHDPAAGRIVVKGDMAAQCRTAYAKIAALLEAASLGLPAPVVDGQTLGALLAEQLLDWLGPRARLRRLAFRFRGPVMAGETVRCTGAVTGVERQRDGDLVVRVEQRVVVGERVALEGAGAEVVMPA